MASLLSAQDKGAQAQPAATSKVTCSTVAVNKARLLTIILKRVPDLKAMKCS
jgi:hypothetical protein